jgi:hypothetical protein
MFERLSSLPCADLVLKADEDRLSQIPQTWWELLNFLRQDRRIKVVSNPENHAKVRAWGEKIYELSGHPGMQMAFYFIQAAWAYGVIGIPNDPDAFHPGDISCVWDGIGVWRH